MKFCGLLMVLAFTPFIAFAADPAELERITRQLASDRYQGRGTAQKGGEDAARFIAAEYEQAGLSPLPGKEGFLLPFAVTPYRVAPSTRLTIAGENLASGTDFVPNSFWLTRSRPRSETVSGELVYLGYGIRSDALARDDIGDLDLEGKIVLLLEGVPETATALEWAGVEPISLMIDLARRGVSAILVIGPRELGGLRAEFARRRGLALADIPDDFPDLPPSLIVAASAIERSLYSSGIDLQTLMERTASGDHASRALGVSVSLDLVIEAEQPDAPAYNILGYVEGSDPGLRQSAVVVTAHYDAYGEENGRFFPGAGDNAAGVAMMLSMAREMARNPPRRSVIFAALSAHEMYLNGSFHFLNSGAWPLAEMAANINIDGIGSEAWGPLRMIHAPGFEQTTIGAFARAQAEAMGLNLVPDTFVRTRLFQRSDALEFARRSIPAAYYVGYPATFEEIGANFDTAYRNIHFEGDRVTGDWDWSGSATMAQFLTGVVQRVADSRDNPEWVSGSPFNFGRGHRPWINNHQQEHE